MRRLTITEIHGLYVIETSAGVRASGASLHSALDKVLPPTWEVGDDVNWLALARVFDSIRPSGGSAQIVEGQAGA